MDAVPTAAGERRTESNGVSGVPSSGCLAGYPVADSQYPVSDIFWDHRPDIRLTDRTGTGGGFHVRTARGSFAAGGKGCGRTDRRGRRMVFCSFRFILRSCEKLDFSADGSDFLRNCRPFLDRTDRERKQIRKKQANSVPSVSGSCRSLDDIALREKPGALTAGFTVEAAFIMGILLWTMGFVIRTAYIIHDQVTGAMILQEAVEKARNGKEESERNTACQEEAVRQGNPRLWLGNYLVHMGGTAGTACGAAEAGDWFLQIEMKRNRPDTFLRIIQALMEKRGGADEDQSGIPERDEPQLSDHPEK